MAVIERRRYVEKIKMNPLLKYTCQCCGYKTHTNEDNSWEICEVCFWQTCPIGNIEITTIVGPNPISLVEAQYNFIRFGACNKEMIKNVRKPKKDEPKDKNWRNSLSNNYLVQKFNLTKDWKTSWDNIIYNINDKDLKEKGLLLVAINERFVIDAEYQRNPDKYAINVKEGQLSIDRFQSQHITEVVEKMNDWIAIINKKIIEIKENKTDEVNHIEKIFDVRIRIENQVYPSKLTLWMNYDYGIEKIRNVKLKVLEKTFIIENTFEDYERMLFDLQITLPKNYKVETCFFCKFSNYFVAGNDNFGDLNCFKNCKEVLINVKTKHDIIDAFENGKEKILKVEETHFCKEFEKYTKDDHLYKLQIDNQ